MFNLKCWFQNWAETPKDISGDFLVAFKITSSFTLSTFLLFVHSSFQNVLLKHFLGRRDIQLGMRRSLSLSFLLFCLPGHKKANLPKLTFRLTHFLIRPYAFEWRGKEGRKEGRKVHQRIDKTKVNQLTQIEIGAWNLGMAWLRFFENQKCFYISMFECF